MANSGKKSAIWRTVAILTVASSGCTAPSTPVPTVWQFLGIPQATLAVRDGLANRSGNRPGLERTPRLLRIADPLNMLSENPAIKAAAEIKAEEDLAPQKVKALKYLASVGCGCYDKDGKIEEALLAALSDCTDEVRIEAANAIREAAGTCRCTYDGCSPTCCKPSIVKRLYDMAYGVDAAGCAIEPSREVRAAAARAMSACSAVPQTPEEPEAEPEVQPEEVPRVEDGEALPPPPVVPPPVSPEALPRPGSDDAVLFPTHSAVATAGAHRHQPVSTSASSHDVPEMLSAPDNMVIAYVTGRSGHNRVVIRLDDEYDLDLGNALLVLSADGQSIVSTVLAVDGNAVEIGLEDLDRFDFASSPRVFLGLLDE